MKKIIFGLLVAMFALFLVCCAKEPTQTKEPTNVETKTAIPAEPTSVETKTVEPTPVEPKPTEEPTPVPVTYSVEFNSDGGSDVTSIEFNENEFPNLPVCEKEGFNFLGWFENDTLVESINENKNYTLVAKWEAKEILPESIEIIVSCTDEILYSDTECYLTCRVYPEGASQDVTWKAMNRAKATLNDDGKVIITAGNEATFKVTSNVDDEVYTSITLKIRSYINPYNFVDSIVVESNEVVAKDIKAWTNVEYSTYLLGSVVKYLFEDLVVDSETYMLPEGAFNRPGKTAEAGNFDLRYITVHDVGGTGNAQANARYCNNPGGREVSWHYTVGNDAIYQQIPDDELGWHAGDGTWDPVEFYDTGILAPAGDDTPAKITINQTNGKIMVNGQESLVYAAKTDSGAIVRDNQIAYTGINNYVDTDKTSPTYGHYMVSKTYWNTTYNTLCSRGGNMTSIGIESTVNDGSNIFYTWEKLAKLIGKRLLINGNLQPRNVVQHNTWSGKDCPMTMRHAGMWETFMEYVTNEYIMADQFYAFTLRFECDSEYINSNGMIKKLPDVATEVTFKLTMTSEKENINIEKEYKVTLPAKSTVKYFG